MSRLRIIPRLDIKGPNLVKGIHLEGLRVLGDPHEFAKYYYETGADELIYIDVVASLFDQNNLGDLITKTAKELFVPLTVGGGLRSLEDIERVLTCGADKVSINTAALKRPEFIKEGAEKYGASTILVTVEVIKHDDGEYYCYYDNGREFGNKKVIDWVKEAESLGAGEIMLTSVDKEGTGLGLDKELILNVSKSISIPLIAHGGFNNDNDIAWCEEKGVNGLAIASALHYHLIKEGLINSNTSEGNKTFIKSKSSFNKITTFDYKNLKKRVKNG